MKALVTNTRLVEVRGFFARALKACKGLALMTRIYMYLADKWQRTMVVQLAFN